MQPVIFLDKDGTLISDVPYNVDIEKISWAPGACEGISRLSGAGFSFIIVSNQPGVAQGRFKEEQLKDVHYKLEMMMKGIGAKLLGFYYCPHFPQGTAAGYVRTCDCRKPRPGLIYRAFKEHEIELSGSWFIGDILDDVEAGNRAGLKTILLDCGHENVWQKGPFRKPWALARDWQEAAGHILNLAIKGESHVYAGN